MLTSLISCCFYHLREIGSRLSSSDLECAQLTFNRRCRHSSYNLIQLKKKTLLSLFDLMYLTPHLSPPTAIPDAIIRSFLRKICFSDELWNESLTSELWCCLYRIERDARMHPCPNYHIEYFYLGHVWDSGSLAAKIESSNSHVTKFYICSSYEMCNSKFETSFLFFLWYTFVSSCTARVNEMPAII